MSEEDKEVAVVQISRRRYLAFQETYTEASWTEKIKPSNSLYQNPLSCQLYRSRRINHECTSIEKGEVKDFIKQIETPLRRHHLNGEVIISVLDFLDRSTREANIQKKSEAQAFVTLLSFLEVFHISEYAAMASVGPSTEGWITGCPDAVKYLLINYVKAQNITKTAKDLWDTKQKLEREAGGEPKTVFRSNLCCFQPLRQCIFSRGSYMSVRQRAHPGH